MEYLVNNRTRLLAFLFSALTVQPLLAQTTRPLSLQEAIQLGLAHSKQLKVADARIREAAGMVSEARLRQYPDLKVSGAYMRVNQPDIDLKVALGSPQQGSGEEQAAIPAINQLSYAMANLSLPLFAGMKIRSGIESAQYLKKAIELDGVKEQDEVIQNTIAAYYNLYKAQAATQLMEENLRQAQQRVQDFENLEKNGLLARNDLLKARLQESNVALALLDAENNRKIANFNINLMLGISEPTLLDLDKADLNQMPSIGSMEEWEQLALTHRADYKALQQRQEASRIGVKAAKGDYYPSLALTGGYVAAYIPDFLTVTNAVNVGVGVSYNLASLYKTGAKVKQAQAAQEQLYWSAQQTNDVIRMQVHQAYQNYLQQNRKIEVYQKAVEQAHENYRITKNKYDNALATTTDLLDADVAQLQASINYEYAKADALVAYNRLYETAGLLEKELQLKP